MNTVTAYIYLIGYAVLLMADDIHNSFKGAGRDDVQVIAGRDMPARLKTAARLYFAHDNGRV